MDDTVNVTVICVTPGHGITVALPVRELAATEVNGGKRIHKKRTDVERTVG